MSLLETFGSESVFMFKIFSYLFCKIFLELQIVGFSKLISYLILLALPISNKLSNVSNIFIIPEADV